MHFLPLLDQNAQPVKAFDEAGCQTSPLPSERTLGSDPQTQTQTQVDFMSLEDFDNLLLGLDANATSARDDVAVAPPTYSDAVTQNNTSSSLGLDQRTLVSDPTLGISSAAPEYVGAAASRCADDTQARPQRIDRWLNPAPPGIYMRARPMVWDATTYERQRPMNEGHRPQAYAQPYAETSDLPPWRRPSIAHVAFWTPLTDHGDVFGPYAHTSASQPDAVPRYPNPVPRSLTYPPPPNPCPSSHLGGPKARVDPWAEHGPSRDTPLPTCAMPGTYPPSPPRTCGTPSYDAYSTARQRQRQGSRIRRPSSIHRGCESCSAYPSPPPSPSSTSSVCTDSTCSSPELGLELHLSMHTAAPAAVHTTRLSTPQASVVNISIALPSPCSSPFHRDTDKDWFYHRVSVSSFYALLIPLVFLIPVGAYVFNAFPFLPSSSRSSSSPSGGSVLHHAYGPLIWRAVSSLLSFVLRMVGDADVKI